MNELLACGSQKPFQNAAITIHGVGNSQSSLPLILNAISVTREGENKHLPIHAKILLAKAPQGPAKRVGLEHVMSCYVVWKFAQNIDGAKKFLADYIDNFHQAFVASEFYNFPCFASSVPDLKQLIADDPKAEPHDKYAVLSDVLDWATDVGYPGYASAAIDVVEPSRYVSWPRQQLEKFLSDNPDVRSALQLLIGKDLAAKLARARAAQPA